MDTDIKILVVDDSLCARRFIEIYLKKMGIERVVAATNARSALDKLNKEGFDLILSDWNMPGMSGLAFLKTIRDNENYKDIPFLMITAEGLKESIAEAFSAGASKYILKPYTYETLKREIFSIIREGDKNGCKTG